MGFVGSCGYRCSIVKGVGVVSVEDLMGVPQAPPLPGTPLPNQPLFVLYILVGLASLRS